jgi:hypothetical protein
MKNPSENPSLQDAILPSENEPAEDVIAWQVRKLQDRKKAADEGLFASNEDVKAVLRKFIPNG